MDHDPIARIQAYFRTHEARDEAAHFALLDPELRYTGAVSGIRNGGRASYRGIFRGISTQFHLNEVEPREMLGAWPEYLVTADLHFQPPGEPLRILKAIWRFVFNEQGLIQELGIFWSPKGPTKL